MSHCITVRGNFGSAQALKDELNSRNISFNEEDRGGEAWLTFGSRYTKYGNPLEINLTNPTDSHMDADLGRMVGEWYQGAQRRHVEYELAMAGHQVVESRQDGGDIVLMVAVG